VHNLWHSLSLLQKGAACSFSAATLVAFVGIMYYQFVR